MLIKHRSYTRDQLDKIGNSIVFFAERMPNLSKTKVLKLLYLLDEYSIKTYGIPFLNLEYKLWQAGPVNIDIYSELSSDAYMLKDYINLNFTDKGECFVAAKRKFDDSEFSENELELLEIITKSYRKYSAAKLVQLCHRPNTLWYKIAEERGLLESFAKGKINTTDIPIPLVDHIKEDEFKLSLYNDHKEFLDFSRKFKA